MSQGGAFRHASRFSTAVLLQYLTKEERFILDPYIVEVLSHGYWVYSQSE